MPQPDWTRGDLRHSLRVLMLDPNNYAERGELQGVAKGGSLDLTYYGDKRMAAKVSTFAEDDGYDGNSALRLVHVVSDYTGELWSETLGTFFVTDREASYSNGFSSVDYTLDSALYALEAKALARGKAVKKGTSLLSAARQLITECGRKVSVIGGARDTRASAAIFYDYGKSYLSAVFDLCERCRNLLSVDANGTVTIAPYVAPSSTSASFEVAEGVPRGMFIPPLAVKDNSRDIPERYIVHSSEGDATVVGIAQVAGGTRSSHQVRGYTVDEVRQVSDLSPFNATRANQLAQAYLRNATQYEASASHGMMYRPLREGQVELLVANGEAKRWMIANASLDLGDWTWSLDLKGGWNAG